MTTMRRWIRTPRILIAVMVALLAASVGTATLRPSATTVGTQLSISTDKSVVGVTVGTTGLFAVTVSQPGSLLGPLKLTFSGTPKGVTVNALPNPVATGIPAIVVVQPSASTPAGSFTLKVTATSDDGRSASIDVKVNLTLATGFTMAANPVNPTVVDGESTTVALSINRGLLAGPITLSLSGVPQYATATVSPSLSLLGSTASITIKTATNVLPGVYPVTVTGQALLASSSIQFYLEVKPQTRPNFSVKGQPDRLLTPGGPAGAIDVAVVNVNDSPMTVSNLAVSVVSTSKPGCGVENYAVVPYSGPASYVVPASSTTRLSQVVPAIPRAQWPAVRMINTSANQDVCKGASVTLRFTAKGDGQ